LPVLPQAHAAQGDEIAPIHNIINWAMPTAAALVDFVAGKMVGVSIPMSTMCIGIKIRRPANQRNALSYG
jgi:hypothetical protein